MAIQLKDRIYTTCPTIGKADIEIGAVKEGYQGWESITDGNTVYYCITDSADWEVGYGVKTGTEIVRNLLSSSTGSLLSLDGNSSVFCTYPAEKSVFLNLDGNIEIPNSNINAKKFSGDGGGITNINADANNLVPEAPTDNLTYARNNKTWVNISDSSGIPDAPVDGLQYGRQDGEWTEVESGTDGYTKAETNTLLDEKADKSTTYTKAEVDASQGLQDTAIQANTDAIANIPTPVDTYTKTEIDAQQQAQDNVIADNATNIATNTADIADNATDISTNTGNISSNTNAIGTLSGQVAQNSEDISELQNSIFFTSAYSADYPSNPNRDPEDGNMYLQNVAQFTYSYAEATQIFVSKTDESGNVRQFTAVQPGDSIVLNEVNSPNFGRYELATVEDVNDSYVVMNVIPKIGQGTVISGANIAFQAFPKPDSAGIWTDVDGDAVLETDGKSLTIDANVAELGAKARITTDTNSLELKVGSGGLPDVTISDTGVTTEADMTVNGITVGKGNNSVPSNTALGNNALSNITGAYNTAIGNNSGVSATSMQGCTLIGHEAEPSSPDAQNEITLGNSFVTKVRMGNGDLIYPMSSPILYTAILGTEVVLPNGATISCPFVGTGWSGDAFIVPKTGIYFLDASFQWSLINPLSNQLYRNAYIGKNGGASFFQTSMGVNVQYPYGSINEFTWIGELNEGDAVRIGAQQANVDELDQSIPTGFNNSVYANFAYLGTGDASSYVANKLVQQLATKVENLEQKVKELN